jgi:hypothetical protein
VTLRYRFFYFSSEEIDPVSWIEWNHHTYLFLSWILPDCVICTICRYENSPLTTIKRKLLPRSSPCQIDGVEVYLKCSPIITFLSTMAERNVMMGDYSYASGKQITKNNVLSLVSFLSLISNLASSLLQILRQPISHFGSPISFSSFGNVLGHDSFRQRLIYDIRNGLGL